LTSRLAPCDVRLVGAPIPLVRAAALQVATGFLERTGAPVERSLARAKLSPQVLEDPEALVPFAAVARFLEETARSEGMEDLGLSIGRHFQLLEVGTFGRLIGQSLTLGEAIETAYRILPAFNSGVRAWLTRGPDEVQLYHVFVQGSEDCPQFAAAVLMQYLYFVRSVAGPGWRPSMVQVPMSNLPGCRTVPLLSEARVEFGQPAMTITFAATLLHHPLPRVPIAARNAGEADWERTKPADADDVGGAVRQIVTTMLADGYPHIQLVAEAVRMGQRTLQRRLHQEGLTFARVVAQARFDAARRMLDDPARKVIDVALDLGYSDPAHFTRAFERWAGLGPREFRRLRLPIHPS
jgi:AraC-like DNA-binding protein